MCGNYSREETIQGRKLYEEIRYIPDKIWDELNCNGWRKSQPQTFLPQNSTPNCSTMKFSIPWFKNSWLKSPRLKSSWLSSLGLNFGVEKSGVEISFNRCNCTRPKFYQEYNQNFIRSWITICPLPLKFSDIPTALVLESFLLGISGAFYCLFFFRGRKRMSHFLI